MRAVANCRDFKPNCLTETLKTQWQCEMAELGTKAVWRSIVKWVLKISRRSVQRVKSYTTFCMDTDEISAWSLREGLLKWKSLKKSSFTKWRGRNFPPSPYICKKMSVVVVRWIVLYIRPSLQESAVNFWLIVPQKRGAFPGSLNKKSEFVGSA